MKCIICHGEDIQVTEVKDGLKKGNDIVEIVYVPVRIADCRTCGKR
jgi:hypothetical protein